MQFRTCQPQASPQNRGGEHFLMEKKEEVERGGYEQKSLGGKWEFRVMVIPHWLGCC